MKGHRIGYIRVSSVDQNTSRQLVGEVLDRVFTDMASGRDTHRPQLALCLEFLRDGDILVAHSLDRLARNLDDLRRIISDLTSRGITVRFLKENLTFTADKNPMSTLLLSVMGAFAEFERELIRERQREGVAIAKAAGKYKGRKPSLQADQIVRARNQVKLGVPLARVARELSVSRQTLYSAFAEN